MHLLFVGQGMGNIHQGRSGWWMETEAGMACEQSKCYYLGTHTFIMLDYCLIEFYSCTEMRDTTNGD
jgi:hypothetical protein